MGERLTPNGPFGAVRALKAALSQKRSDANDTGASLILALVFLIVAALTLTALVTFAGTGLLDTAGYTSQRGRQYGASGAIEIAIQGVRYTRSYYPRLQNCLGTTPNTSSSVQVTEFQVTARYRVYCQGAMVSLAPTVSYTAVVSGNTVTTSALFNLNHQSFVGYGLSVAGTSLVTTVVSETPTTAHTVQLETAVKSGATETIDLFSPYQRLVTFYACRKTTATTATAPTTVTSATTCVTHKTSTVKVMTPKSVLVKAVVGFGDLVLPTGKNQCETTPTTPPTACGKSYVVIQWTVTSANH